MRVRLIASMLISIPTAAQAQDKCGDVLATGTFQTLKTSDRTRYEEYVYRRFASQSSDQGSEATSISAKIPYEDVVYGGNAAHNEKEDKRRQVERVLTNQFSQQNDTALLLYSGDATIVDAWLNCMRSNGGGPAAYFSQSGDTTGHTAFLTVEWIPGRTGNPPSSMSIRETIKPPTGISFVEGKDCVTAGTVIPTGTPCVTKVNIDHASTSVDLAIRTNRGDTVAVLPPRLRHIGGPNDSRRYPYSFDEPVKEYTLYHAQRYTTGQHLSHTVTLSNALISEGFEFASETASAVPVVTNDNSGRQGVCTPLPKEMITTEWSFTYGYYFRNFASDGAIYCRVDPSIQLKRDAWVPADSTDH